MQAITVRVARHFVLLLALMQAVPTGSSAQVTPPPPAPTQAAPAPAQATPPAVVVPPQSAPAPDTLVFSSDVALVLNAIKPDKVADFEAVMARLLEALQRSTDATRRQQGAGWKVLKASEPGPAGTVLYVFVLDPVVKGADYTVSRILAESFPDEVGVLWPMLRDAYSGGLNRLSLLPLPPPVTGTAKTPQASSPKPRAQSLKPEA